GSLLVGSPFSLSTADSCDPPSVDAVVASSDQTAELEHVPTETTVPALEGSFLLEGLTAANPAAVDYGHDMQEHIIVDRSPTHRPTLDKVLGQVQPTISGLTMSTDANEDRGGGLASAMGTIAGGNGGNVRPAQGGDMQDLSLSMKSVNFDTVNETGDASMQQDTIMLNDFDDIDLVDFHMHSLDSDGPFPMITNHDPDPAGSTGAHRQHTAPHEAIGLFCSREDANDGVAKMLTNGFTDPATSQQHMHDGSMLHDHANQHQHTYLNNNDLAAGSSGADCASDNAMDFESLLTSETDSMLTANNCHRMMLDCAQDKPMFSYLPDPSILDYFSEDCNGLDYEIKHLEY
uniref:Uncharacterized protein n=1 Tax=Anopheles maculatus TaxID=74869 RepID=A0A182S6G1_9DIPT